MNGTKLKELLLKMAMSYFILASCIMAAIAVLGMKLDPDARLTYRSFSAPLKYAFIGIIPTAVMYSSKELSRKQLIIRKVIQLILTEAEILFLFITAPGHDTSELNKMIAVMVSIFVIFTVLNLINFINGTIAAKKMNVKLLEFQGR